MTALACPHNLFEKNNTSLLAIDLANSLRLALQHPHKIQRLRQSVSDICERDAQMQRFCRGRV
jgi:hypothetical protein